MLSQLNLEEIRKSAGLTKGYPTTIGDILSTALRLIFPAAGILLLIYLVFGGFSLMTSGGDPKAIQAAKGRITSALIGFVIVFASYWIVQIIGIILGLTDVQNIFG